VIRKLLTVSVNQKVNWTEWKTSYLYKCRNVYSFVRKLGGVNWKCSD